MSSHTKNIQLSYIRLLFFVSKCVFFVPDDGPSEGPKHVAFLYKQGTVVVFD